MQAVKEAEAQRQAAIASGHAAMTGVAGLYLPNTAAALTPAKSVCTRFSGNWPFHNMASDSVWLQVASSMKGTLSCLLTTEAIL